MKQFFCNILLYGCISLSFSKNSSVSLAISQIISDFYVTRSVRFDFIIYEPKAKNLSKVLSELTVVKAGDEYTFKLMQVRAEKSVIEINNSAVMLFDTLRSYQDFHRRVSLTNMFSKQLHFLIYISDLKKTQINLLLSVTNEIFHFETILLHDKEDSICLVTFITFQQPNCRAWQAIEINRFSKTTKNWENREFFVEKFDNFNGCQLIVEVPYPNEPSAGVEFDESGVLKNVWGYSVKLIEEISHNLNFKINFNPYQKHQKKFYFYSTTTDFVLIESAMRYAPRYGRRFFTHPMTTSEIMFLISKNDLYTQFEKIFLPFEFEVWVWLIITMSTGIIVISIIKLSSKHIQNFVFGSKVSTPMLNLV